MRGSIVRELILLILFFGVLLVPMTRLTGSRVPAAGVEEADPVVKGHPAWIRLRFAHLPERFRILVGETLLWQASAVEDVRLDRDIVLPLHQSLVELSVQVHWPPGTPETVCELILEPDGLAERRQSAWGESTLDEIMAFSWAEN